MFLRFSVARCLATVKSEGDASVRGSLDEGDEDPAQQVWVVLYCMLGKASLVIMVLAVQASPVSMPFLTFQRTAETQDQVKEQQRLIDLLSAKRAASECRNPLPGTDGIGAFIDPKTLARACGHQAIMQRCLDGQSYMKRDSRGEGTRRDAASPHPPLTYLLRAWGSKMGHFRSNTAAAPAPHRLCPSSQLGDPNGKRAQKSSR